MKLIGPPGAELRRILATYIMCPCYLYRWPIFPKIGNVTPRSCWMYVPILKFIDILVLKYSISKCRFNVPIARQPALPWQPLCVPLGDLPHVSFQVWTWYDHPVLSTIFDWIRYVTLWPWPFDFGVMSRDATWVSNPCTKFEQDTTYRQGMF